MKDYGSDLICYVEKMNICEEKHGKISTHTQ